LSPGSPFNYYCLDAASLLPVIMLDINFGDSVLDMCAGKKWTMF
jgi:16S rRNA C967 or C1407 C5-methylase (RsmB/RsmF family)